MANRGGEYTFPTLRVNNIIDITFIIPLTPSSIFPKNWRVLSEESFSYHKYLTFELGEFVEEMKLTLRLNLVAQGWCKATQGRTGVAQGYARRHRSGAGSVDQCTGEQRRHKKIKISII